MRTAMVDKRARKMVGMTQEMTGPSSYGPPEADTTYVCWGSTYGPLREAVDQLNASDHGRANLLHFVDLWPFPAEAVDGALAAANRIVAVEGNSTAQLASLIRTCTGRATDAQILRDDGRPLTPEYVLRAESALSS